MPAKDPEKRRASNQRWYQNNRGKKLRQVKIYQAMNYETVRESANARRRERKANDPQYLEAIRAYDRKWKAKKKSSGGAVAAVNDKLARLKARAK